MSAPGIFPKVTERLGLGVGMDLPWGDDIGFERHPAGDRIRSKVGHFLQRHARDFSYLTVAYQPRNRETLESSDYHAAFDTLMAAGRDIPHRAFHHTLLNTGAMEAYDRHQIIKFTNELIERYGFLWVVEDIGLWSLQGKSLPYPLPPVLTPEGLDATVENVAQIQASLAVPLCLEFPGFTEGATIFIEEVEAYDFFAAVAERTASPVTLDVGHLLSYQWLKGRVGERRFEGLERLPVQRAFEIHLSGCGISNGKFRDLHHGVLLDEQLDLLQHLLTRCPNLKAITYEDPRYDDAGVLIPKSVANYERLKVMVEQWKAAP